MERALSALDQKGCSLAGGDPFRRRYRILLWLDEAFNADGATVERYTGGDRTSCDVVSFEPFDNVGAVADACVRALVSGTQLELPLT